MNHQIGDILTSIQNLEQDLGGMGVRQIARISEDIVSQIRKILHGQWSPKQMKHLKELQKVAVAIKKAIEEKDDLKELIPQLSQTVQSISTKLGVKQNDLQSAEQEEGPMPMPPQMQLTGNGPQPGQPPGQQPPPMAPPGQVPMGQPPGPPPMPQ